MKIQDFAESREDANFINTADGVIKNKAQLTGEIRIGILCMLGKGKSDKKIRESLETLLDDFVEHTQELEKLATAFVTNLGKPTPEEVEDQAKKEEAKKTEAKIKEERKKKLAEEESKKKAEAETKKKAEAEAKKKSEEEGLKTSSN